MLQCGLSSSCVDKLMVSTASIQGSFSLSKCAVIDETLIGDGSRDCI